MELSKRLQAVANLVTEGLYVADIGTDHGYIPIYLIETEKTPGVIAMDINRGPLARAKDHVAKYHLESYIETRLSNGLDALDKNEVQSVIIAGMGGGLVIRILEQGRELWPSVQEFILQPQSELAKVRTFLETQGFHYIDEDMVYEDGKYYPMMKVTRIQGMGQKRNISYHDEELLYGPLLLGKKHPVLRSFLEKDITVKEQVLHSLADKRGQHIEERQKELREELDHAKYALCRYHK